MQVEVTDADREAAKSLLGRDDAGPSWWSIDSGNADSDPMVQAFARHRIAEHERVVGEVERWLWETDEDITGLLCWMNDRSELTAMLQAKFGGRDAD